MSNRIMWMASVLALSGLVGCTSTSGGDGGLSQTGDATDGSSTTTDGNATAADTATKKTEPEPYTLKVDADAVTVPWYGGSTGDLMTVCASLNDKRELHIYAATRKGSPACSNYDDHIVAFTGKYMKTAGSEQMKVEKFYSQVKVVKGGDITSMGVGKLYPFELDIYSLSAPDIAPARLKMGVTGASSGITFSFSD